MTEPSINKRLDLHTQTNLQSVDAKHTMTDPSKKGVTVAWLSDAFEMNEATVRHRLRNCPVRQTRKRGEKMQVKLYDLKTASRFLVAPAYSTKEYMKSLKRGDLPPQLQQAVWDALLKRQKWEEQAGQLWRTEQIREVLGSTFQTMKFTIQLWTETLERQVAVTDEQRKILTQLADGLQADLYDALVNQMRDQSTKSSVTQLADEFGETERLEALMDTAEPYEEYQEIEDELDEEAMGLV